MIIVGLTGGIGSGKTTFAQLLTENLDSSAHWESWHIIAEVATALRGQNSLHPASSDISSINEWIRIIPALVAETTHKTVSFADLKLTEERIANSPENFSKLFEYLDFMHKNPDLQRVAITETNKEQFRSLLQWLGGYLVLSVDEGIWYDEIIRRIHETDGLSFASIGGVRYPADAERIRAAGGSIIYMERPGQSAPDMQDLTERQRQLIDSDTTVLNDATLEDLAQCAKVVLSDLQNSKLAARYTASATSF